MDLIQPTVMMLTEPKIFKRKNISRALIFIKLALNTLELNLRDFSFT